MKQALINISMAIIFMGVVLLVSTILWFRGSNMTNYRRGFADAADIYKQNIVDYDHTVIRLKEEIHSLKKSCGMSTP